MGILTRAAILDRMDKGLIRIDPFSIECLGSNSYDVHLGHKLARFDSYSIDCAAYNKMSHFDILPEGYILYPGKVYLASTTEYTEAHDTVPYLDGKSSLGRLGISIHATAGRGDVGYCNNWTMQLHVIQPTHIYPGMVIGQLTFFTVDGPIDLPYRYKPEASYASRRHGPVESTYYKKFVDGVYRGE